MKALESLEQGNKAMYKIYQLSAVNRIQWVWLELNPAIICNCWTELIQTESNRTERIYSENLIVKDEQEILEYIRSTLSVPQQLIMKNFIEPADGNHATSEI